MLKLKRGVWKGLSKKQNLPYANLQISPLGLVPKQKVGEYRVIHHLSYPEGSSINDGISKDDSIVEYQTIDDAIELIKRYGKGALLAKTDIEHGYKIIPIHPSDHELLGFAIGDNLYFDKTLPMGLSFACNLFERFSTAIHWIVNNKLSISGCVHYLDDFLLVGPSSFSLCNGYLKLFLQLMNSVGGPNQTGKNHPTNYDFNIPRIGTGFERHGDQTSPR